jgi:anti-sigma factor RsiW
MPIRCRDFRRLYSTYRDGTDPALVAEMEDHLEACAECAAYDRAVRHGVDALRGVRLDPSPDFLERLNERIATAGPVPEPVPPRVSPWAATAVALLLGTLVVFTIRQSTDVPPVAAAEKPAVLARPQMVPGIPFVTFGRAP